jgi:hypothetical protein
LGEEVGDESFDRGREVVMRNEMSTGDRWARGTQERQGGGGRKGLREACGGGRHGGNGARAGKRRIGTPASSRALARHPLPTPRRSGSAVRIGRAGDGWLCGRTCNCLRRFRHRCRWAWMGGLWCWTLHGVGATAACVPWRAAEGNPPTPPHVLSHAARAHQCTDCWMVHVERSMRHSGLTREANATRASAAGHAPVTHG